MSTPDAGLDTMVAGVRCREVLDDLSELLDGGLTPSRVADIQAHLAGCDRCARFGGEIASTLELLRSTLREPPPIMPAHASRLRDALQIVQAGRTD